MLLSCCQAVKVTRVFVITLIPERWMFSFIVFLRHWGVTQCLFQFDSCDLLQKFWCWQVSSYLFLMCQSSQKHMKLRCWCNSATPSQKLLLAPAACTLLCSPWFACNRDSSWRFLIASLTENAIYGGSGLKSQLGQCLSVWSLHVVHVPYILDWVCPSI